MGGLVLMQYTGVTDIDTYIGTVTGTAYPFGLFRMKGYVDGRDVDGLLALREDSLPVFKRG